MKKFLFVLFFAGSVVSVWAQTGFRSITPASIPLRDIVKTELSSDQSLQKNLTCLDTLYYPYFKEEILGTPSFYTVKFGAGESASQAYINSTATSVTGARFDCAIGGTNTAATVNIQVSLYNVDAAFQPTTAIAGASATVAVTGTTYTEYGVTFSSPVSVSGNYAVVLSHVSAADTVKFYFNNARTSTYGEGLGYLYFSSAWYDMNSAFGGTYDFDVMAYPVVSYPITTSFTVSENSVCPGTPITFTGTNSPSSVLSNRMYNGNAFYVFWGLAADTLNAWVMDGSTVVWSTASHTYTYAAAGTYNPVFILFGGSLSSNTCTDTYTLPITVYDLPTVTASASPTSVCPGGSSTLTGGGASTYTWDNGLGAGASFGVTPTSTTTYNVTGTDANTCSNTASVTVTVLSNPTITATATPATLCTGQSTTLTAGGATSYLWDNGLGAGSSFVVTPLTTTVYAVTGTDANSCTNTASVNVAVAPCTQPTAAITASDNDICVGQSITYSDNSSGVNIDTWAWTFAGGSTTSATTQGPHSITYSTAGSFNVTLQVADDNGTDDTTITIIVHDLPTVSITPSASNVCEGVSDTLTSSGALTYVWNGGSTINPYTVSPTSTTTYSVTGTDANGCSNTSSTTIVVNAAPTVNAAASPTSICAGESAILTASGNAIVYSWDYGSTLTNPITVTPATTTIYVVGGINASGCTGTASVVVTVNPLPTVTVTFPPSVATVCQDSLVVLSGGSPAGGTWSGTGVSGNDFLSNTTGSFTITYSYTDGNGCTSTNTGTIVVEICTSISEYSSNEMIVYPNPASDVINIAFGKADASQATISLFDISGRLVSNEVLTVNGSSVEVSVNKLPAGVYTLKVTLGSDVFFAKISKF